MVAARWLTSVERRRTIYRDEPHVRTGDGRPEARLLGPGPFHCRTCGRWFNERGASVRKLTCLLIDIIGFAVFCQLRDRPRLHDFSKTLALRRIDVSHEVVRRREAKLPPVSCAPAGKLRSAA